jgi:hypothetical protein
VADRDDRTLAACYRVWGKAAAYTPPSGGASTPCSVMFIQRGDPRHKAPLETVSFHGVPLGIAESEIDLLVRVSEIAQPEADGTFVLLDAQGQPTGSSWRVGDTPFWSDITFKEWRCCVATQPFGGEPANWPPAD